MKLLILSALLLSASLVQAQTRYKKSYADTLKELTQIAANHPESSSLFTLGDSDSGQKIQGIQIGHGSIHNLVVATHHGNEYGSTEVALAFAASVSADPLPNQTVFVVPVLNIEGFNSLTRTETSALNKTVYDPNRNYPSPCGTEGPFTLKDTAALSKFVADQNIIASATLHTFSPAVTYPWGLTTQDLSTGYESIFKGLVTEATRDSHYKNGNTSDLIYPANGTFEDYAFLQYGIWSLLFELGSSHSPSESDVKELIRVNVPGLRRMLVSAPTQRAEKHAFNGKCDNSFEMSSRDLHNE